MVGLITLMTCKAQVRPPINITRNVCIIIRSNFTIRDNTVPGVQLHQPRLPLPGAELCRLPVVPGLRVEEEAAHVNKTGVCPALVTGPGHWSHNEQLGTSSVSYLRQSQARASHSKKSLETQEVD